jgi:hypothetical protein
MTTDHETTTLLSLSRVREYLLCGERYRLKRILRHTGTYRANLLFGSLMHAAIARAYRQPCSLPDAVEAVWGRHCAPVIETLRAYATLDAEYRAQERSNTKQAKGWRQSHPAYDDALTALAAYQTTAFGHYRWGQGQSLATFYRRSRALADGAADLILPGAVLVEGQPLHTEDAGDAVDHTPIRGVIAGVPVVGVPDVVARDGGVIRVVDYKTGRATVPALLAYDAQLTLYVELLRQAGVIARDEPVVAGQITLGDDDVTAVWLDGAVLDANLARVTAQFAHVAAMVAAGIFPNMRGLYAPSISPCSDCEVAHVCEA